MSESYVICRKGQRPLNQDRAGCFTASKWHLGFVADGMGGHRAGEQASEIVARACSRWWDDFSDAQQRPGFLQGTEQLRGLLEQCHREIGKLFPSDVICGTTAVLLWIVGREYAIFSVGDSRCYEVSPCLGGLSGRAVQLTHDDVSEQSKGKLLRALGPGQCSFSLRTGQARRGAVFALCSDGIYKFCPDIVQELKYLTGKRHLKTTAEQIAAQVEGAGAPDNYSLLLLRI